MTAQRTLIPALVLAAGLACTASAQAQPYGRAWGHSRVDVRLAFDNGYRSGLDRGRDDARHQRYDYSRHDEYRNADWGYERSYGDRTQYRDAFRRGFMSGYDDGYYGRNTRNSSYGSNGSYGPYGNDGYRAPVYGNGNAYPSAPAYGYPSAPAYGYPSGPAYGGSYGYNPGFDRGYREGLDKGRNDGKHHDSYNPRNEKWYREGDRGYKDEYGSKRAYENAYRDGFLRGYDEGYREQGRY
jgi:hypothetical protein